jgi:hypothetical protein
MMRKRETLRRTEHLLEGEIPIENNAPWELEQELAEALMAA